MIKRSLTWLDCALAIACSALKDAMRNHSSLVEIGTRPANISSYCNAPKEVHNPIRTDLKNT